MVLLVAAILAILSGAIVVYPFLKARSPGPAENLRDGPAPAAAELGAILDSIRTLQLEHELGEVPEGLYREQLRAYRLQAASILRYQVEVRTGDPGRDLEREVLTVRLGAAGVDGSATLCPSCGAALRDSGGKCTVCGAEAAASVSDLPAAPEA